nr:retrovirus-related Pol polyprotein from transposon TNT 1-94 [Tanacetum cinerariifolium]
MRPFDCPVTILNTLDSLGKFDGKVDEGFLVGYPVSGKAFRVFNSRTRIVQETLHVNFLENKPNVVGSGPTWLFDIDTLTKNMNYQPVTAGKQSNPNAGVKEQFDTEKAGEEIKQQYVLFLVWSSGFTNPQNTNGDAAFDEKKPESKVNVSPSSKFKDFSDNSINEINAAEPKMVHQALKDPSWIEAMQEELLQFKMQNVWVLVDLPYGKRAIGTKWIFRNKKDERGIVVRNKARLLMPPSWEWILRVLSCMELLRKKSMFVNLHDLRTLIILTRFTKWSRQFMVYIKLLKLGLTNGKSASTPIDTEKPLLKDLDAEDVDVHTYRSMNGSLIYLTSSRLDIMLAIDLLEYKKQTVVATSSTKAKYVAVASCCAQVLWIQNQLLDYGMDSLKRMVHVTHILSAGSLTSQQMVLNSPCLTHIKNWLVQIKRSLNSNDSPLLGVNTLRSNEDRLELIELTVFLLPSDEKVGVEVSAVDLQVSAFWTTVAVKKVNGVTRLQALVDKKKVVVMEATIRDALCLDDAKGVECLPNEEIFTELATMGYEKPSTKLTFYKAFFSSQWKFLIHTILQCMSAKRTSWNEFISSMASAVICLSSGVVSVADDVVSAANEEPSIPSPTPPTPPPQPSHDIPSTSQVQPTPPQSLQAQQPTPQPQSQPSHDAGLPMDILQNLVKKLERRNKVKVLKLRRLQKVGTTQRIDTSDDTVMDDVSNQGRMIADMDADADVVLEEAKDVSNDAKDGQDVDVQENVDIQGRTAESQAEIYKIDLDHANKVLSMQEEESEPAELQEVVDIVTTAKIIIEVVTTASTTIIAADVPVSAAATTAALTLTVAPIRRTNGVVIRDPGESTTTTSTIIYSEAKSKDKAKFDSNVAFLQKTKEQIDEEETRALKRINETPTKKAAKRQKLNEKVEELKRHLQIVPNEEDDVYIEATPLARKVPGVDYKIINQNNKPYYKIKRANGSHQLYLSFLSLLRNFDREDLEALWSLVKERFATTKPKNFLMIFC